MGSHIKANIDKLLNAKGWTIYRLSKESGVPATVLYSLEDKKKGPTADNLIKIADAFKCTVDEIVREQT